MSTPTPPSTPRVPPSVAFVRQQFSHSGGAELILDRTIAALASHGARISLIAREWRERPGITFLRCESGKFPRATRDSRFAAAACGIVAGLENTLVQSHERIECCDIYRAGDGVHAAYLERRARTLGAARRFFQNISPYHRDVLRLERRMFASPRLKAVVVNSKMVADEIVAHFGFPREKIHLVPNGIDLGRFSLPSLADLRKEARADLNLKPDAKVLLLLGSGYERKGLPQAIAALAKMATKAELLVVGRERKPSYYRELASRHGIAGRVHIFGEQADPVPYLAAADAMILPSLYDPFPSAVLEALACGLPVVTSENCGARDAARELDRDMVCDALDIHGIASAADRALALAAQGETKMRCRAIAEQYRMEFMIERMLALYEKLAAAK